MRHLHNLKVWVLLAGFLVAWSSQGLPQSKITKPSSGQEDREKPKIKHFKTLTVCYLHLSAERQKHMKNLEAYIQAGKFPKNA